MAKNRSLSLFDGAKNMPDAPLARRGKMSEGIESRNYARIALKGQRFRPIVNGVTGKAYPEDELPVLIVDWAPALQRLYFEGSYDPSADSHERPVCFSDDGKKPNPASTERQSASCNNCPMNAVGSGQNGQGRACQMMRRLLVKVVGDHSRLYTLDLKSKSIFKSDQDEGYFCYQKYAQTLDEHGVDPMQVITGISFDEKESVPVVRFRPVDYPDEAEVAAAAELYDALGKEEVARILSLHIDSSGGGVTEEADGDREVTKPDLIPGKKRASLEDEKPEPRARRAEPEDEDEPAPRRRRAEPEDEDEPAPRRRRAEPEDAEVVEEKPAPRARRAEPEDEDEPAPRRRRAEPEDDDKPAKTGGNDAQEALKAKMRELGIDPDNI